MADESSPVKEDVKPSISRYQGLDPNQVLSVIPLLPFHEVADIGAGTGYFTVPLGKHLFDGKVFGLDEDQAELDEIQEQLDRIRLTNVTLVKFSRNKIPLEDSSVDGVVVAFYLHGSKARKKLLEEGKRILRNGGWIVVLEWFKREMEQGPPSEQRIDTPELRELLEEVGFRFTSRHDLNNRQYMLVFRK